MKPFEYVHAPGWPEAVQLSAGEGARAKGAGFDLLDLMKEHLIEPSRLVSLERIPGADAVAADGPGARIGPLARLSTLAANDLLRRSYTAVAEAAGEAATPQIRNRATAAGNLLQRPRCPYFRSEDFPCMKKGGDVCYAEEGENRWHSVLSHGPAHYVHPSNLATGLMVFDARLVLASAKGEREVALTDFWVLPADDLATENRLQAGELITAIRLGAPPGGKSAYREVREKQAFDWPLVACAVSLTTEGGVCKDARICLGAVAPIPWTASEAAQALVGKKIDRAAAEAAAERAFEKAQPLAKNGYKIPMGRALLARTILECV